MGTVDLGTYPNLFAWQGRWPTPALLFVSGGKEVARMNYQLTRNHVLHWVSSYARYSRVAHSYFHLLQFCSRQEEVLVFFINTGRAPVLCWNSSGGCEANASSHLMQLLEGSTNPL